jgi:pyruvate dehydrogenase E2 component (dihydrolipoamide acetyltransferase)
MPDVIMPRLSDSMEEGTILRWLKADGDEVKRGEELLEIETDKATMTYEADASGTLRITAPEGAVVPVGEPIGFLGDRSQPPARAAPPAAERSPAPSSADGASGGGAATLSPPRTPHAVKASPMARRAAERHGIELASVTGSGPSGRILKADVVAAAQATTAEPARPREVAEPAVAPAPAAAPAPAVAPAQKTVPSAVGAGRAAEIHELSRTQALIARRMAESRATVPEFALEVDVDMSATLDLRERLKPLAEPAPSLNDIVVKACALALRRHPRINGSYRDGHFELHPSVNVGIAVAAENALIVPTVFDADTKSLGAIANDARRLVQRVRERTITPPELDGGTFTVSNLGMYGIDRFEGIINAPQAAILCVGAIADRPVAVDGEVVIRPMMSMTLACDHRILYGADAAEFLSDLRRILEEPLAMVL